MTTMAPERGGSSSGNNNNNNNNGSRTLHNFSLPPCLSWGTTKLLRCSNSTSNLNDAVSPSHNPPFRSHRDDNQIDVMRENLIYDLRSEADKLCAAFLPPPALTPAVVAAEGRPWNLRTRRRSPVSQEVAVEKCEVAAAAVERVKFSVRLSREEVEDDFVAMLGRRPPRKPKKRPRYVQKQLETIFPGVWLSEITADMYKVDETPEPPK